MEAMSTSLRRFPLALCLALIAPVQAQQQGKTNKPPVVEQGDQKATKTKGEKSVKPGINKSFLSKKLNVSRAIKRFEGESREIFVHRHRITKSVGLEPGMAIADIGAGTGLFLELFAKSIGAGGKLYAVDIAPKFIEHLTKRAKQKKLTQVEVVQCNGTSSKLPKNSVDLVFVCDTYHHFEYPKSTLHSLHQAIRPGGELVIVDFERIPGVSRKFILGHVRCGKQKVIEEIVAAGFRYVGEVEVRGLRENYFIRFKRRGRTIIR